MTTDTDAPAPTRFRTAEERGVRLGRPLRLVGRVKDVDEALMEQLGRRLRQRDELGAAVARGLGSRGDDRVTMSQVHRAVGHGIDAVPDAPASLRAFFDHVEQVPDWVDMDLVNRGARAYRRYGRNAADVLLQLSLIGGYRFGGPTDLLVATGGLTGDMAMRRLGETQRWGMAISEHDAMRPGGEGFRLTVHVRLMHALVNHRFEQGDRWDVERWGLPINQSDQAATLGLFNGTLLLGVRALGVRVTRDDSRAVMHLWKYVGWLMGIDEDWLFDKEREQHRFSYHVLLAQADVSEAGPLLAQAIVDAQLQLHHRRFARVRRTYERERLLSMLRVFLGREGLRDLDLPVRPPWAVAGLLPLNVVRHHVLGRTSWGDRRLHRRAARARETLTFRHFGADAADVGRLVPPGSTVGA